MIQKQYAEKSELLKNKVILITGAGDGIGKAVSIACAKHSATVILLERMTKKLNQTYDEIIKHGGTEPIIYQCDMSKLDDKSTNELVGRIDNEFGRLDGLLHNAAILGTLSPYEQFETELWQKIFQVNVHAPFILSKYCLPLLRNSNGASIIFTGSGAGLSGDAYWGAYSASKFANEGMMQTLAEELMHEKIKVNLIDPAVVRTKMRALAFPAEDPIVLPAPEDIVNAYLYLLSDDSAGITKQRVGVWR